MTTRRKFLQQLLSTVAIAVIPAPILATLKLESRNFVTVLSATTTEKENPFTVDQLHQLANTVVGTPISWNFNLSMLPIGIVRGAEVTDRGLIIKAELIDGIEKYKGAYIVPGYRISDYVTTAEGNIIGGTCEAIGFGVTLTPNDPNLDQI